MPTGINQEKLWLHYNFLPVGDALDPGRPHIPPFVFVMEALETCRSLVDVEELLLQHQRSDGMMLFAVDGKTDEFAIYECGCNEVYKRVTSKKWIAGTNHYCMREDPDGPLDERPFSTLNHLKRLEALLEPLDEESPRFDLPGGLIKIMADDQIERRDATFGTVYSNVACPSTGEIWYTFGGYPAASRGNWQRIEWPWPDEG